MVGSPSSLSGHHFQQEVEERLEQSPPERFYWRWRGGRGAIGDRWRGGKTGRKRDPLKDCERASYA